MAKPKYNPNEFVTRKMLDEAVDAILKGVESMFKDFLHRLDGMDNRFESVDRRFDKIEVEVRHIKDQVRGLRADLSDTPSRGEFQKLKSKVDRHHPAHG